MLSKKDRERDRRIADEIARAYRLAESASSETSRRSILRTARDLERVRRYHRTFPRSIWMFSLAIFVVMLPATILVPEGYAPAGVVLSAVTLVLVLYISVKKGSRHGDATRR